MYTLRPLGIGEILDRAVTLSVRNFWLFAALAAVMIVPPGISAYYQSMPYLGMFDELIRAAASHAAKAQLDQILARAAASDAQSWPVVLNGLFGVLYRPFGVAALAAAISAAYLGGTADLRQALLTAARSWLAMLWFSIVYLGVMIAVSVPAIVAFAMLVVLTVMLGAGLQALKLSVVAAVGAILLVLLGGALAVCAAVYAVLLYYFGCFSVVTERRGAIRAIGSAFSRVFGGTAWRYSLVAGLALGAVTVFIALLTAGAAALGFALSKSIVPGIAAAVVVETLAAPFCVAMLLVLYYDARVRREGLDLELATAAALADSPAPG
jgi:hypothetical protein